MQMSFIRYRPRRTFRSVLKMFKYFFFQMFTTFFSYNLLSVEMPDMFSVHYGNAMKMTSFHKGKKLYEFLKKHSFYSDSISVSNQ